MSYTAIIYDAEEGGYWAEVPELPGCVSQGESLDELEKNIIEAIEACLETYKEDNLPRRRIRGKWDIAVGNDNLVAV